MDMPLAVQVGAVVLALLAIIDRLLAIWNTRLITEKARLELKAAQDKLHSAHNASSGLSELHRRIESRKRVLSIGGVLLMGSSVVGLLLTLFGAFGVGPASKADVAAAAIAIVNYVHGMSFVRDASRFDQLQADLRRAEPYITPD